MRRIFLAILFPTWAIGSLQCAAGDSYNPRVGQRHPDFVLPTISDGKPLSLSQFRGKKVLLIQFASW